jgi:hypothetical protein
MTLYAEARDGEHSQGHAPVPADVFLTPSPSQGAVQPVSALILWTACNGLLDVVCVHGCALACRLVARKVHAM